jgi:hypothetical protein
MQTMPTRLGFDMRSSRAGGSIPPWSLTGPKSARVLRGGSWNNNPRNLRSANRNRNQPDNRNNNNGFRVASTLPCLSIRVHGPGWGAGKRPRPVMMMQAVP